MVSRIFCLHSGDLARSSADKASLPLGSQLIVGSCFCVGLVVWRWIAVGLVVTGSFLVVVNLLGGTCVGLVFSGSS